MVFHPNVLTQRTRCVFEKIIFKQRKFSEPWEFYTEKLAHKYEKTNHLSNETMHQHT